MKKPPATTDAPNSSAGVPPAVSGASRPRFGTVKIRDRGWLPHWEKEGAAYFVTFRLADSLPKAVLDRTESEKQAIVKTAQQLHRPLSADELRKMNRLSSPAIEQFLDNGSGACYLKQSSIAGAVANALCHFDAKRIGCPHGASSRITYTSCSKCFRGTSCLRSFTLGSRSRPSRQTRYWESKAHFGKGNTTIT